MATVEELLAARAESKKPALEARAKAHAAELEAKVFPVLDEDGERFLFPEKGSLDSDVCGFVVLKPASEAQIARYRSVLWRAAAERGAVEAKAKAGPELAKACVVYPSKDVLDQLIEKHPMLLDKLAVALLRRAEAQESEEGKG